MRPLALAMIGGCAMVVRYDDGSADDTGASTETAEPEAIAIVGDGPADGIGAGGLWIAPDLDGDGHPELVVGAPALGAIGVFDGDELAAETPFGAAYLRLVSDDGLGAAVAILANGGSASLAVGQADDSTVWIVSAVGLAGSVVVDEVASGEISADEGEEDGAFGAAVSAGDFDGDGIVDLAIGAPSERDGDGRAYVVFGSQGYTAGTTDPSEARVRIRGIGRGLGTAVVLGDLDGTGLDGLLACEAPGQVCHRIVGPGAVDDRDVDEVATSTVSGATGAPRIADVDGDGTADLLLIADGVLHVFFDGLVPGAQGLADAALVVSGPIGAATGDGTLLAGVPDGLGAVYALEAAAGSLAAADGTVVAAGSEADGRFGAVLSDVGPLIGPTDLAIGAPGGAGKVTIVGR